jgi:alpha-D-ribose 1-methylphosphonate 5-triphosphate synthase subunit PhnG
MNDVTTLQEPHSSRRRWMAVLARASATEIATLLDQVADRGQSGLPHYTTLRGPESGLVMVRGRMGGGGGPFNLGEMTVTRCTVRTATGHIGHAYVAGRDARQAELAAVLDALLQDPAVAPELHAAVIEPLAARQQARRSDTAAKAAATKVEFFAMQNMRS